MGAQTLYLWRQSVGAAMSLDAQRGNKASSSKQGALYAVSPHAARLHLRRQGIRPQRIWASRRAASESEKTLFMRQLAMLTLAQVPLLRALEILASGAQGAQKWPLFALLQGLIDTVEAGKPLHQAFARAQAHWGVLPASLIQAGEISGTLPYMLSQLADYMEERSNLHRTLRAASIYPLTVLLVSGLLIAAFLGFIIPSFAAMYQDAKTSLPWITLQVMAISDFLRAAAPWLLGLLGALLWAVWRIRQSQTGPLYAWHLQGSYALFTLPLLGRVWQKAAIARWAQTTSVMLEAGLPLLQTLPIALATSQRFAFSAATERIHAMILAGQPLSEAMTRLPRLFDGAAVQMVAVGEETGALALLLAKLANLYSAEVREAIQHTQKLLQPLVVMVLGLLISGILLALYLPIFQMGQVV